MATIDTANTTQVVSMHSRLEGFADWYFTLKDTSAIETTLKVISYVTLILPALILTMKLILACTATLTNPVQVVSPARVQRTIGQVLDATPSFDGYKIGHGTRFEGITLTTPTIRPSNLLFHSLFGVGSTTLPGGGLFRFNLPFGQIRDQIFNAPQEQLVEVTARGAQGQIRGTQIADLAELYGPNTFRISYGELASTLQSQKVYLSPLLPKRFYLALKEAMRQDQIVILPGNDGRPQKLNEMTNPNCRALVQTVSQNPRIYGFESQEQCNALMNLTLYQVGSLVVKCEDFRIMIDAEGKIRERNPGEKDAVRLINACGIRGIHNSGESPQIPNRVIMQQAFQTALQSAESGFVVFPAVGMGVWGGDPDLYWRAFLEAVAHSATPIEKIFVNPGHQTTRFGRYQGHNGSEFSGILNEYKARYAQNPLSLENLNKILNLFDRKTDIVHLSQNLKTAFPEKSVSIFNASDPDVTLGHHVGEYVNNLNHATTTEENFTALGTNGLCFEGITGVLQREGGVVQAAF